MHYAKDKKPGYRIDMHKLELTRYSHFVMYRFDKSDPCDDRTCEDPDLLVLGSIAGVPLASLAGRYLSGDSRL